MYSIYMNFGHGLLSRAIYRTMLSFRATSSNTFIMSDVQSILHSIINSGLVPGGQILNNRQTNLLYCSATKNGLRVHIK